MAATIVYFRDFGNDVVSTGIPTQITATAVEQQELVDQLQAWSRGENDGADSLTEIEARIGNGSNNPDAQSGVYAYIEMKDNITGDNYRERLPMPDLGKADDVSANPAWISQQENGKSIAVMNSVHADYAAFKAGIEDVYVSPNGNTAQLVRVYLPNKFL